MNYLYNGVELPALPEVDTITYPFATMVTSTDDDIAKNGKVTLAYLIYSSMPLYYKFGFTSSLTASTDGKAIGYVINTNLGVTDDDWKIYEKISGEYTANVSVLGISLTQVRWANYNLPDANGEIYIPSSIPIPVTQPTRRRYNPMSRKGGYKIINLGDADLSASPKITGIYDAIEGNHRKRLVLSGITINAVEYADIEIEVTVSAQNFTFTAYGKTITITPEDIVSVA